jgi:TatD DNase family protein
MLTDSHAHLDDPAFDADRDQLVPRASAAGVTSIITVGTSFEGSRRACDLAERNDGVWASVGCHPHEADRVANDPGFSQLRDLASRPHVVAIGETGLDYAKNFSSPDNQKALFRRHLRLAADAHLPVVIHCRDAHEDVRAILKEELPLPIRGVIHCFSGNARDAEAYLEMGFVLSIAGPVTFANAIGLREAVRGVPMERLLVETDCPYLTPVPHRGKRNEPAYVRHTAEAVAALFGVPLATFAEASTRTARELFRL